MANSYALRAVDCACAPGERKSLLLNQRRPPAIPIHIPVLPPRVAPRGPPVPIPHPHSAATHPFPPPIPITPTFFSPLLDGKDSASDQSQGHDE